MRTIFVLVNHLFIASALLAQSYPDPEFSNEIYFLNKGDSVYLVRLEKNISNLESKTKLGGFAGVENGYEIHGSKSNVRIGTGSNLSFVISSGSAAAGASTEQMDSLMRASGMDPSMMTDMTGDINHPSNSFTLYKMETLDGKRKVLMQKVSTAFSFSNKKLSSSEQYTFSVKPIREGYWEFVTDKALPPGEYAFSKMNMSNSGGMDTSYLLFAFGVD